MNTMRLFGMALAAAVLAPSMAQAEYKVVERIKVPDGNFDYATFDPATSRVLLARTDFTTVIDSKTGKLSQLNSAALGHMTLPVPGTTLAVLPQSRGTIRIIDMATDATLIDLPAGKNPDGAAYDPFSKMVFVMNQISAEATVVDPIGKKVVATIKIGGKLEFPASDGAGKIFVNDESVPNVAVLDAKTYTAAPDRYKLEGCDEATGLAYVPPLKAVVSSCRNGMAKVLDTATGKQIASVPIGKGPDAVVYDDARKLVFIPCGIDGVLEVISVADPAHISVVQHVPTQVGSRTATLDPQTGRLYLMAFKIDPAVATPAGGRPARLAGSFEVLVVAP